MAKPSLVFLGLDAGEPALLRRWMESNELPNLAALCRQSHWGNLTSPAGFGDGVFWTSLNTGLSIGRHGRSFNWHIRPATYSLYRFCEDHDLQVPNLWDALSAAGRTCAVVDLVRAKLSPTLNGLQIADWLSHDPIFGARSTPATAIGDVVARYGGDPFESLLSKLRTKRPEPEALLNAALQRIETKTRYLETLLAEERFDVLMAAYSEAHDVGHHTWHLHDETHEEYDPEGARRLGGDPILTTYKALDQAIGRIVSALPPETAVMLVAGPGIRPGYSGRHLLPRVLDRLQRGRPRGLAAAKEGAKGIYRKIVPAPLQHAIRVRRTPPESTARHDDWARRDCFILPHAETMTFIRVNLEGREPQGRIPRKDFDRYRARLTQDLLDLVDPTSGEQIVQRVVDVVTAYPGPNRAELPDLVVEWKTDRPIRAAASPKIGQVRADFRAMRTGDHNHSCFFAMKAPGVSPRRAETPVDYLDVAATIPALAGVEVPGLDGTPLPFV